MKVTLLIFLIHTFVVGKVEDLQGKVEILRENKVIPVEEGMEIKRGDVLKAYKGASFTIILDDGSEVNVKGESSLKIDEVILHEGTIFERLFRKISIFLGRVWFRVKKGATLGVNTPTIVVGVRGTEFETGVALDGSAYTEIEEGEVIVVGEEPQVLKEGKRAVFDVLTGFRVESKEKRFERTKWIEERRKRFKEKRREIRKRVEEILKRRLEMYERKIEEISKIEKRQEWEVIPEKSFLVELIANGIEEGENLLNREGVRWKFRRRFEELKKKWSERKKEIKRKMGKRRKEIKERMEERRREIRERMRRLKKKMRR